MSIIESNRFTRSDRFYWLIASVPPLLLSGLLIVGVIREQFLASQVRRILASFVDEGIPFDSHSLTVAIDKRVSKEQSKAWQEIAAAATYLEAEWSPLYGQVADIDLLVPSNMAWKAEPVAIAFAEQAAPVVAQIAALNESARPVWQPIVNDDLMGVVTQLSDHRSVTRLLSLEFRVAYHKGDSARALRALMLIDRISRALDGEHLSVCELVQAAVEFRQTELIRESLTSDFWTAEQLAEMRQLNAKRISIDKRWRDMIDDERAIVFVNANKQAIESPSDRMTATATWDLLSLIGTVKNTLTMDTLEQYSQAPSRMIQFDYNLPWQLTNSITDIPFARSSSLVHSVMPTLQSLADTFFRLQMQRNWTTTAIGIKQFRLQVGRFPSSLTELSQVGLTSDVWTAVISPVSDDKLSFGYKVAADQSEAILWTLSPQYMLNTVITISEQPPSELEEFAGLIQQMEVRIR